MRPIALGALAAALLLTAGAHAVEMTKAEYKAEKDRISAQYKAAKDTCGALKASKNCICPLSPGVANNCVETIFDVSPAAKNKSPEIAA